MKIILSEEQLRNLIKEEMDEPLGIRLKNLRKLKHRLNNYTDSGYVDRNPWSDRDGPDTIDDTTTSYKEDAKNHLRNLERNHVIVGINRNIEYYTQMIDMIFRQVKTGKYPKYTWAGELKDYKKDIQDYRDKIEKEREKLRKYLETNTIQESSSKMKDKNPCRKGYEMVGKKMKNGKEVPNCVPKEKNINENNNLIYEDEFGSVEETNFVADNILEEAEYQGRKVKLNKPFLTPNGSKKRSVYVKNEKGKVVKVNFGFGGKSAHGKVMKIKKNNPERRKSFRARMNCDNPGPRDRPRYWSCRAW